MKKFECCKKNILRRFPSLEIEMNDNVIVLKGEVEKYEDVVWCGQQCADKKQRRYVVNHLRSKDQIIKKINTPELNDLKYDQQEFDIVIIGAGVVGCLIARNLAQYDLKILLLDKEHDVAMQTSSRNDGMVHPGIDLHKYQIKYRYNLLGNKMFPSLCHDLDVEYIKRGQYIGFFSNYLRLIGPLLKPYWSTKDIKMEYIKASRFHHLEPEANKKIKGALFFPDAGCVSPYELTIAAAENAVDNGVILALDTIVKGFELDNHMISKIITNRGVFKAKLVINAAGVFSDKVAIMANDEFFSIHPRKGTNIILDKNISSNLNSIVSTLNTKSLKNKHSKGGGCVKTIDENILIGPNAKEVFDREDLSTDQESIEEIMQKQTKTLPKITSKNIINYFSGIRAATYEEDFIISKGKNCNNIIHVAGIQSPGLTAAPAIALDVGRMAYNYLSNKSKIGYKENYNSKRKGIVRLSRLSIAERNKMIKENPDYGEIVCRCELISKGEIIDCLNRSVPCDSLDGVKRRVRAGMGRCQGGFCGPVITNIIAQNKEIKLENVLKNGLGSEVLVDDTKKGKANEIKL